MSSPTLQTVPPQAVVMQIAMGGWVAQAMAEISRLNIPDMLQASGPATAAELAANGLDVNVSALERVMRACADDSDPRHCRRS